MEVKSFNIMLLGLKDPSETGRARYVNAMHRLTGRPTDDFSLSDARSEDPIFNELDRDTARLVANALVDAGVLIEVRRSEKLAGAIQEQLVATTVCPSCGFLQESGGVECSKCGLVFAKFEREQVQKMQKGRHLEEALQKALQSRDEWAHRAAQYLESHPMTEDAIEGFENVLLKDELPFLRLVADEGPIMMTSRRMIASLSDGFLSIPFEVIADVTLGGGLVQKKSRVRMTLDFHAAIPTQTGTTKTQSWQLDKDSSFYKDVVMDWAYARNFICGACGARDLDYRHDAGQPRARCMHCATDHEIDITEAIAIPIEVKPEE